MALKLEQTPCSHDNRLQIQGVTGGCKGLQGVTGGYQGLQEVTEGYKGSQGGYRKRFVFLDRPQILFLGADGIKIRVE